MAEWRTHVGIQISIVIVVVIIVQQQQAHIPQATPT
jgi:hypothetical protein